MLTKTILILAMPLAAVAQQIHYPLPKTAVVSVGPLQKNTKDSVARLGFCDSYTLDEKQVREQFRTYHLLGNDELENYDVLPCWHDGTIRANGKTYRYSSRMGNTMWTDWPDGKGKMLVGEPSDDESNGAEKKQKH